MDLLTLFLLISGGFLQWAWAQPCSEYTAINDAHRSSAYISDGDVVLCDQGQFVPGNWYRFTSYAGGTMPEECVPVNSCGTIYPVWMNGGHPNSANPGPLTRQACVNGGDCCDVSLTIQVQWCEDENNEEYFVYSLADVPGCHMAYCAGDSVACPYGQAWNKYQNQCVDEVPHLDGVHLNGPVWPNNQVTGKFHFECEIDYPTGADDGARFQVTWWCDGTKILGVPDQVVDHLSRSAILLEDYLRGNLGKSLTCKAAPFWEGVNIYGPNRESNDYWMGIYATDEIIVQEGNGPASTRLVSTLPITCGCCSRTNCYHTFDISIETGKLPSCSVTFTVENPEPTLTVEAPYTAGTGVSRVFEIEFTPIDDFFADPIWEGYVIEPVKVTIIDDMVWKHCYIHGDPYFETWDWMNYEMRETGRFYILKTETEFEIQGIFKQCDSGRMASCLCAIAVRYKNSVLGVDACDGDIHAVKTFEKFINSEVSFAEFFFSGGDSYEMHFPEYETWIYIDLNWETTMNVFIESFMTSGSAYGLCGTPDDNIGNEFFPFVWDEESFYAALRIPNGRSFFDGVYECESFLTIDNACECDQVSKQVKCGHSGSNVEYDFGNVCDLEKRKKRSTNQRLHERSVDTQYVDNAADFFTVMDYEFDNTPANFPELHWPTPSGVTEEQADTWCLQVLQSSQAFAVCEDLVDLGNIVTACKLDIKVTDDLNTAYNKLGTLERECGFVAKSKQEYGSDREDETIVLIQSIKDATCPKQCLRRGTCVEGHCQCDAGYAGSDCSLDAGALPEIQTLENDGLCDLQERPCVLTKIWATNLDYGDNLVCKIKHVLLSADGEHKVYNNAEVIQPATMITKQKIQCVLPLSPVNPNHEGFDYTEHGFYISVSLDAVHYSEERLMVLYDSLCRTCQNNGTCIGKDSACDMNGQCYFGDECSNPGEELVYELPNDHDQIALYLVDDSSLERMVSDLNAVKRTLAHEVNEYCVKNSEECCQALGYSTENIPTAAFFQWTDASHCVIKSGDKKDEQTLIHISISVPGDHAGRLCGVELESFNDEQYFHADVIYDVMDDSKTTFAQEHGVEFMAIQADDDTTGTEDKASNKTNVGAIVGGVIGGLVALVVIAVVIFLVCKAKKRAGPKNTSPSRPLSVAPFPKENSWMTDNADISQSQNGTEQEHVVTGAPPQSTNFDFNTLNVKANVMRHGLAEPLG